MRLKHVYLYLNPDEFHHGLVAPFGFRTRYLCNFLERRLGELRFHAEGFSKICVQGRHRPDDSCPIRSENAAIASVAFDQQRYEALGPEEHHEFFIRMLCDGLERCARHHHTPLAEMLDAVEDFRREGYRNDWTHQTKLLRPAGLRASLLCSLDPERFILTLRLDRKGDILFEEPILETKPDEIVFAHRFKEVALDGEAVVVKDRFGKPVFCLDLGLLG